MSFAIAFSFLSARLCTVRHAGRAGAGGPSSIGGRGGREAEAERRNLAVPGAGSQVIKDCIERNKKKVNVPVATQANTPLQRRAST